MVAFRRNQVTKRAATSKNLKPTKLWTSSTWQGSKTVARESSPKDFPPFESYGLWDFVNFKNKSSIFLLISPLHKFHYFPEKKLKKWCKNHKWYPSIIILMSLCFCNSVLYFFPSPPSKSIFMLWFCVDHWNTQSKLSSTIGYVDVCKTRAWEWGQLNNDCCHQCRGECLRYEPC